MLIQDFRNDLKKKRTNKQEKYSILDVLYVWMKIGQPKDKNRLYAMRFRLQTKET